MRCWAATEFFHHGGHSFAIFADFDAAQRAVANFQGVALVTFAAFSIAWSRIADEELRRGAVAFPILRLAHEVAVIQTRGFNDHHAGQGVRFAECLAV